ncbi:MAG: S8 family peptidase [Gulosibacter sp.]|uniref:S8 family peptidase n=1 Tax=Gulosibacter sp. TaxID=2817531 RepID=UPI003F91CA80
MKKRERRSVSLRRAYRAFTTVIAATIVIGLGGLGLPDATAKATADDGLWYFDDFGIESIHEAGTTGDGVTVAVIDSPINLDFPDLEGADIRPRTELLCPGFTGVEVSERAQHATAMTSFIVGNGSGLGDERGIRGVAPETTVLHYAVLDVTIDECAAPLDEFVRDAIDQGADVLNFSISYNLPEEAESAVALALDAGLIVNVAVQNANATRLDLLSGLAGVVSIENIDRYGEPDAYSVTGAGLDFVAPGVGMRMPTTDFSGYELADGTSPATAWTSGVFALALSAWPDATGNQILHSAICAAQQPNQSASEPGTTQETEHASSPPDHIRCEPESTTRTEASGYGLIDPAVLIAIDPSEFPDQNPLFSAAEQPADNDVMLVPAPMMWLLGGFVVLTGGYIGVLMLRRKRLDAHPVERE